LLSPQAEAHADAAEHSAEAGEVVMAAIAAIPASAEAAQLAYEVNTRLGRTEEASTAASIWRQRVLGDPYHADLAFANAELTLGRYDSALSAIERWRERMTGGDQPNAAQVEIYATALAGAGRIDEAHDLLWDRAVAGREWAFIYMRVGLAIGGPTSDANEWFERIADVVQAPVDRITMGQIWLTASESGDESNRLRRAAEIFEALHAEGQFIVETATLLGLANEQLGDYEASERWYRKAVEESPDDSGEATLVALNNLAYLLTRTDGVASEAVEFARRAVTVVRDRDETDQNTLAGYLDTLGEALRANGEHDEAIEVLAESLTLNPDSMSTRIALAQAHLEAGNLVEARERVNDIRTSLLAMPDPDLADRLDDLQARLDEQLDSE
jgi:tetratricopeptide (TPR) repeat protein